MRPQRAGLDLEDPEVVIQAQDLDRRRIAYPGSAVSAGCPAANVAATVTGQRRRPEPASYQAQRRPHREQREPPSGPAVPKRSGHFLAAPLDQMNALDRTRPREDRLVLPKSVDEATANCICKPSNVRKHSLLASIVRSREMSSHFALNLSGDRDHDEG